MESFWVVIRDGRGCTEQQGKDKADALKRFKRTDRWKEYSGSDTPQVFTPNEALAWSVIGKAGGD